MFLGLVPVLLFNYVGFELQNGAAEEMEDPQKRRAALGPAQRHPRRPALRDPDLRHHPRAADARTSPGIGGFIDAVTKTFSVYGGAAHTLLILMTICFVGTLVTSGAVWMIGSDRIQAVAAYDGAFFPWFGVFNRRFGTPVRVNVMSGIVSTVFCFSAIAFFNSGENATFQIVLDIAISTTLISYIWIFPAALQAALHPSRGRAARTACRSAWPASGSARC